MTLADILANLDAQDEEGTILAEPPWSLNSRAVVVEVEDEDLEEMTRDGQTYFLEVDIALEARDGLQAAGWHGERLLQGIIHYAIHDAWPDQNDIAIQPHRASALGKMVRAIQAAFLGLKGGRKGG